MQFTFYLGLSLQIIIVKSLKTMEEKSYSYRFMCDQWQNKWKSIRKKYVQKWAKRMVKENNLIFHLDKWEMLSNIFTSRAFFELALVWQFLLWGALGLKVWRIEMSFWLQEKMTFSRFVLDCIFITVKSMSQLF